MHKKKILVSWIGHADLRAMANEETDPTQGFGEQIKGVVKDTDPKYTGAGPLKTMLTNVPHDYTYLLSTYPKNINSSYRKLLGFKSEIINVSLNDPTDYGEVFTQVDAALKKALSPHQEGSYELSFLLSPGTPTMAAIWVLLGKTKYPAKFYQTYKNEARETTIPFDVSIDYVQELLKDSDRLFQHLSARSPQDVEGFQDILGDSQQIRLAVGRAQKAAVRDVSVLLLGESGTGKEMFAKAIHCASHRSSKPFIVVNCAAIPKELLESQLFGHVKGSFTGANRDHDGVFKQADGGILFLDEVGECAFDIQAKLLRVLQPPIGKEPCLREFYPVGADKPLRTDVRVIAATNKNLLSCVEQGSFREDLYYRLCAIIIKLPALRDRKMDIPILAKSLLEKINEDFSRQDKTYAHKKLSVSANKFVKTYYWTGNVRELYNVLLQSAVMSNREIIDKDEILAAISETPKQDSRFDILEHQLGDDFNLQKLLDEIQVHYLQRAMKESNGVKTKASTLLGMNNYQTLDAQLKRLGVNCEKD